VGRKK